MRVVSSKSNPLLGGFLAAKHISLLKNLPLEVQWGDDNFYETGSGKIDCGNNNELLRVLARSLAEDELYGTTAIEKTEVDHWLTHALSVKSARADLGTVLIPVDKALSSTTFLASNSHLTIADFAIFAAIYSSKCWQDLVARKEAPNNVLRWFKFVQSQKFVSNILENLPDEVKTALAPPVRQSLDKNVNIGNRSQEGKFVELIGAEMGKVVVRFPPEASGYLHIGHAKAALLNQYYQESFKGKLIMRFDDTNPAKENAEYEKVILEDVKLLEVKYDIFSHTSQHFDLMLQLCEKLLKEGKAYVDDTEPETMKTQREQKIESINRKNTIEQNFTLWEEMKNGSDKGQKCCVRAKIDMQSPNGCLRDPTIYRCKNEAHPRTGTKYRVYPTYDFACPIVDSIEGVTHVLRTMEYHDRDPQFFWFIEALELRKPHIWEYSRLSMTNTVLSKRKLTWFVNEGFVTGWDDPRMPTVRGVMRRGMTVQGLKEFIVAQGSSRSVVFMEWDKIWSFNKKVIDPIAPRFTAIEFKNPVTVNVSGVTQECLKVPKHPKNNEIGSKSVWIGRKVLIDRVDAESLVEGENATFINWGNIKIKKIFKENTEIVSIDAEPNLENKDYKKTLKLTWLADTDQAPLTPTFCIYFDHLITKAVLGKDEDFKQYINHDSKKVVQMLGDPELKSLKKGDIIQLQRRGFFKVDAAYQPFDLHICKEHPIVLFSIPDGHTKEGPFASLNKSTTNQTITNSADKVDSRIPEGGDSQKSGILEDLSKKIVNQGDKIRKLKSDKVDKNEIDTQVKNLLKLKQEFKEKSGGKDWTPIQTAVPEVANNLNNSESSLLDQIAKQGDLIRDLKAKKAEKTVIDSEVKVLLNLKNTFKTVSGKDWTPTMKPAEPKPNTDGLVAKVNEQGNLVRDLKAKKASKEEIDKAVKQLLALKAEYKNVTGTDFPTAGKAPSKPKESQAKKTKEKVAATKKKETVEVVPTDDGNVKKQTRLGLEAKKEENLSEWYSQVITKSELIEYYDVSGCYIFRPWSFAIWRVIKDWFSAEIDKLGVEECYFPIFVSKAALEKEKTHIADFAPEVAWVTKSGDSELAEPIAVRPTSETVMYPAYAKWVQSYRDLPIKLNQWNNVVRWEFKHPQPFLRTREFLWQEGHSAFASKEDACNEVKTILDLYATIYTDILAIPVVKGRKTEKEKFAGGDYTLTIEAYVSASGRAIQGATSHHLGQNFSKMFEIVYEDPETQEKQYVYQNSWGLTTRTIGVMVMIHGDNKGLVLPPRAACVQIVIVPCGITASLSEQARNNLQASCDSLENELKSANIKVKGDYRNNYSPGWKFNHWELKGVPIRIELGPKDIEKKELVAVRRDTGEKITIPRTSAAKCLKDLLDAIQDNLLQIATHDLKSHTVLLKDWSQFGVNLDKKNIILAPFCGDSSCEDKIKADSVRDEDAEPGSPSMGAKSLCIPLEQPASIKDDDKCIHPDCKRKPSFYTLFGRSY